MFPIDGLQVISPHGERVKVVCLETGRVHYCVIHDIYIKIRQKPCPVNIYSLNALKDSECRKFALP